MRKRNKKAIIITAIVMLIGILLVLTGLFGGRVMAHFTNSFDYKNIKPEDLGKTVEVDTLVYYEQLDLQDKTTQVVGDFDGEFAFIVLDLSDLSEEDKDIYYSRYCEYLTIRGKLRAMDDAEFQEVTESVYRFFDPYFDEAEATITLEEYHQILIERYLPYCIEVSSVGSINWKPFIPAGAVIILIALIFEICFVFKLKKRIVLPVVFSILIVIPGILLFNHLRTILSIKKVADGFYTLENYECTDTQGMLASDSGNIEELLTWILDNHLFGLQYDMDEEKLKFGCAAFAAISPDNEHIFGRNFDYPETDIVMVHSHPEGAYESIGVADLGVLGVGQTESIKSDSAMGRLYMIITPYIVVDGINEKGLGVSILELNMDETHQDTGKPDLLIFCAIRGILDNCASVDEAVEFLRSYDIQSGLDATYHLFITDTSGRYVVVEWLGNEMFVVEQPCCTNSVLTPGEYYDMGDPDERLGVMQEALGSDRIATEEEAMAILDKVHNKKLTEWSCVYNLDRFTVDICTDSDYEQVYSLSADDM